MHRICGTWNIQVLLTSYGVMVAWIIGTMLNQSGEKALCRTSFDDLGVKDNYDVNQNPPKWNSLILINSYY